MAITNLIKRNEYRDSVILMKASEALQAAAGVLKAALMMGTESNKQMLSRAGLLTEKGQQANAGDLIVAIQAVDEQALEAALNQVEQLLASLAHRPAWALCALC
jgi:predicted Zn-dependent peptidase